MFGDRSINADEKLTERSVSQELQRTQEMPSLHDCKLGFHSLRFLLALLV
jgi:hypothetical protein